VNLVSPENSVENPAVITAASERQNASWDVRNASKNYFSLVVTQAGSAVFAFASMWLINKMLGTERYGGVMALIAASQLAQVLVNWTGFAVVRYGVNEFIETEKIARTFWLRLFILLPNLLLVLLTSNFWYPPLADWLNLPSEMFWVVLLHFSTAALWIHFQFSFQAVKMLRLQGGLLTIERLLIFISLSVLAAGGGLNEFSAVVSYAVVPLVISLGSFWILRDFVFARFRADWIFWRTILAFSLPLIPFTITTYLSGSYADAIFIVEFLSTRDLGIYMVATQISGVALQLPTLINSLLLPLFVTLQKEAQTQKMTQYFKYMLPAFTLCWGLFSTLVSFTGYFILPLVFGKEYAEATQPFWILFTTSTLIFPLLAGYGSLSNANSVTYIPMISAILAGFVNVYFNFLLIPKLGLVGCAWATAIMYFVNSFTLALLLRRNIKIPVSWTFIAPIPAVAGAFILSLTVNPYWSLLLCTTLTVFILYVKKESFEKTFMYLRNSRNA
jgi:O-antigen/teichoic acid export membrane protein